LDIRFAIAIPVYNNTSLLKECLNSLQLQTFKKFDTHIYDDASTQDYLPLINSYSNLSLNYKRNVNNLGALANMQFAYNDLKNNYEFVMIMHEDDLLHPQFIEMVIKAILVSEKPSFVISNFLSFDIRDDFKNANTIKYDDQNTVLINKKELSLLFLQLKPIAFGSVIYNTNVYRNMNFDFDQYEEFADRPFLLDGLNKSSQVALINDPLYYYRSHGLIDNRWKKLLPQHVFNLLKLYKEILLKSDFIPSKVFKKHSMVFVFESYKNLLLTGKKYSFVFYLFNAKLNGFFSLKYALLKNSKINKTVTCLKKIFN
jgi:glycosyltransferase involved in cell wall biosynthesis